MTVVSLSRAGRIAASGLGFEAGFADAYSYFHWHAFAANQTGNTVFFAISLFQGPHPNAVPLTLIVCFIAGALLGRLVVAHSSPAIALTAEAFVLAVSGFAGDYGHKLIALAMGMQTMAITTFDGVAASTSFISGDYSRIGAALGDLINPRTQGDQNWKTISVLAPLVVAYALGALIAAYCRMLPYAILLVVPIILAIAYLAQRRMLSP
jgi:uncharacterized membrane protein YoaK (UPF0700 family)